MPEGVTTVAYADDSAIVVEARELETLIHAIKEFVYMIVRWISIQLTLASEKTEAVALRCPRNRDGVLIRVFCKNKTTILELFLMTE